MNLQSLQQEISRYSDISHIFETIHKRGYLNKISHYLEEIYTTEINYAQTRLKEVISLMQKQGAKVEYNVQLTRNIQIFKSNFDLILTAASNQIWNKLLSQITEDESVTRSEQMNRTETIPSAYRKSEQNRFSDSELNKLTVSQSFQSRSPHNMSQKAIPLSEISCVSGGSPSSFSRAKRQIDNSLTTSSPGVGKYKTDQADKHLRASSPSATIGRSPKISWIDEKTKREEGQSPGPIYNPVKTFCSKKLKQ